MNQHPGVSTDAPDAAVLVYVRAPRGGEVKTRLAAEIGEEAALRVYRRLVERVIASVRQVEGAAKQIHYTPADGFDAIRKWLGTDLEYVPQVDGDLGERMEASFAGAFATGYRRVVIVGSDVLELGPTILAAALGALRASPVVLGPATDGGYYLIGLNEPLPEPFRDIEWGTERVLQQTISRLAALGITPTLLEPLTDVDLARDLPVEWRSDLGVESARPG